MRQKSFIATLKIYRWFAHGFYGYRPVSGSCFEFWRMNRNFHSVCLVTEMQLVSNFSSSLRVRSRQTKTLAHWPALPTKLKHAEIRLLNTLYCVLASLHWLVLTTLLLLLSSPSWSSRCIAASIYIRSLINHGYRGEYHISIIASCNSKMDSDHIDRSETISGRCGCFERNISMQLVVKMDSHHWIQVDWYERSYC